MTRSYVCRAALLLSVAGASVTVVVTACGTFDGAPEPPGGVGDASPEAASIDGPLDVDADVPDRLVLDGGCRGDFLLPRILSTPDSGVGVGLRSVRGTASGLFLISYDTSPDDDIATATVQPSGLTLTTPNQLASLNSPKEETSPTGPDDLSFVLFASDLSPYPDGGASPALLWMSEFAGTFGKPEYVSVANVEPNAGIPLNNPYLVGNRVYFDIANELRVGELVKATKKVTPVLAVAGVGSGTHPVVAKNERELFYQIGAGIQRSTRALLPSFKDQEILPGSLGDYPTWISEDGCQLYAISSGHQLHVYDRAP